MTTKKIKKEEVVPHLVIADTNILWFKDKKIVVNPEFDEFWERYQNDFNLELILPEVVKGELLFQHSTSAINSLRKMTECAEIISGITDKKINHKITDNQIKKNVTSRFEKWLKKKNGKILDTPVAAIDWEQIISKAIWREAPFEFNNQKDLNEKGFRDALILETIKNYCLTEKSDFVIAFICNDQLLRSTTEKVLKNDERFIVFESLEQFGSYLKLTHENLTNKFVKSLLRKAHYKFFKINDKSCIYYRFDLHNKICSDFKDYFADPLLSSQLTDSSAWALGVRENWTIIKRGIFWISVPQFIKITDQNCYHWSSEINYVELYSKIQNQSSVGGDSASVQNVLILTFDIAWNSKVTKDARFRTLDFEAIEKHRNSFEPPTSDEVKKYSLNN